MTSNSLNCSVTAALLKKKNNFRGIKENNFNKIQMLPWKKNPEWFGYKTIEPIYYQKDFIKNSASTDFSKEMQVPISKGLKHLNTNVNSAVHYCAVLQAVVYCDMH